MRSSSGTEYLKELYNVCRQHIKADENKKQTRVTNQKVELHSKPWIERQKTRT
jgi:hypothetical protein